MDVEPAARLAFTSGDANAAPKRVALLLDHPWPELDIERAVFDAAGIRLVEGPQVAGTASEIEQLVREVNPEAILTCWAPVSAAAIAAPRDLRIVARLGVGLDNIAIEAASGRGAWVTNVPDYCTSEVSDHAIALLLAHFRGIARLDRQVKDVGWVPDIRGLTRISDLTVGIIGLGRIGQETARKLKAFGCRILAVSRQPREVPDVTAVSLARVQRDANVIILHVPLTGESRDIIDREFIRQCRRRPLIINVSRGGLVDTTHFSKA